MVASSTAWEEFWHHKLLTGLFGQILETMIHCDNHSCVQMSVNLVFHDKSKHIEIQYHFICDMVQKDSRATVYSKPLPRVKFEYFHGRLGVEENVSLLQRERWLRDTYHTFAKVPLLVQVLSHVWEKSHRQMRQACSRSLGSHMFLCLPRYSARYRRNPIDRWVRQVADGHVIAQTPLLI